VEQHTGRHGQQQGGEIARRMKRATLIAIAKRRSGIGPIFAGFELRHCPRSIVEVGRNAGWHRCPWHHLLGRERGGQPPPAVGGLDFCGEPIMNLLYFTCFEAAPERLRS
jgi:hypothetical protein